MPIYEYKCGKCGETSEFIVFNKDEQLQCKQCGSEDLTKLLSAHNTINSGQSSFSSDSGPCCGSPGSCGMPGSCCGA